MYKITKEEFKKLRKSNNIFELQKAKVDETYYMILIMDDIIRVWVVQCVEIEKSDENIRYYFQFILCPDLSDSKTFQYMLTTYGVNRLTNTPGYKVHRTIKIRTNRNLSHRKKLNQLKMKKFIESAYSLNAYNRLIKVLEPYESEE